MLGPLASAIRNSPPLADTLECTSRYLFVHARSPRLEIEPDLYGDPEIVALRYGVRPGGDRHGRRSAQRASGHYLTTTDMPLAQVASLLGLADQATLTRSARRWWGTDADGGAPGPAGHTAVVTAAQSAAFTLFTASRKT